MSAQRSEDSYFMNPMKPRDVYLLAKWLERHYPNVWIASYELDEKTLYVVDMSTRWDVDWEAPANFDVTIMNTWTAVRSGLCENCRKFPACRYMYHIGDYVYAGLCHHCADQEKDDAGLATGDNDFFEVD